MTNKYGYYFINYWDYNTFDVSITTFVISLSDQLRSFLTIQSRVGNIIWHSILFGITVSGFTELAIFCSDLKFCQLCLNYKSYIIESDIETISCVGYCCMWSLDSAVTAMEVINRVQPEVPEILKSLTEPNSVSFQTFLFSIRYIQGPFEMADNKQRNLPLTHLPTRQLTTLVAEDTYLS